MPPGKSTHADFDLVRASIAAGLSVKQIIATHRVSTATIRKLRLEIAGTDTGDSDPADDEEPGEPVALRFNGEDCYTAEVSIPVSRLDWVLGNVTLDEAIAVLLSLDDPVKASAIEFLINRRFEIVLQSPVSLQSPATDPLALWRNTPEGGRIAFAPPDLNLTPQP